MKKSGNISRYILVNLILLIIAAVVTIIVMTENKVKQTSAETSNVEIKVETVDVEIEISEEEKQNEGLQESQLPEIQMILEDAQEVQNKENEGGKDDRNYYRFYYYQLDDNAKKIYDAIENNINNMKTGTYTISLSSDIAKILEEDDGSKKLNIEFQSAWDAIIMDRVELFYIDISKVCLSIQTISFGSKVQYNLSMGNGNNSSYLETGYSNKQTVDMVLKQIDDVSDLIVAKLSGDTYDKVTQVHDWLVDNLSYSSTGGNIYNIYGTFVNKAVVCEGYAEGFKYIMDKIGVPCIVVTGTAENSEGEMENHEWNYIQIDEKWYAVDATWDDPIIKGGGILTHALKYKYFLVGSDIMNKNHFPKGQISTKGIDFSYPKLEESKYKN